MNRKPNNLIQRALIILFLHIIIANTFMLQAQINTNLPVGAIPGAIDVSPMGAATYTIPIEVVPGTQGMQPNLSIVYNSFGGMGLLGMKWNLAGLSAISACGKTPYFDNNITSINFSKYSNDNLFSLDGERLISINGTYGANGTVYANEKENFTRVISHGYDLQVPLLPPVLFTKLVTTHFTVYTDDGTVIEYGHTNDSKQKLGSTDYSVLSWYISKITDANGNYMTYHYGGQGTGEIWVDSIKYTGNTALTPYAKVVFGYKNLPDTLGKNTHFVGGYAVPQTKLLEKITVFYGTSTVRQYKFIYNTEDTGERTAHLKEIVLYGGGVNPPKLNATKIEWGNKTAALEEKELPYFRSSAYVLTGDFNGDGYADFITYGYHHHSIPTIPPFGNGWFLYLYDPLTDSYIEEPSGNDYTERHTYLFAYDVNGDGKDELIVNNQYSLFIGGSDFKIFSLPDKKQIGSTIEFNSTNYNCFFEEIHFGDFDGDGAVEIMIATSERERSYYSKAAFYKVVENNIINFCDSIISEALIFNILDANGNGKKNLRLYNLDGTMSTYEFDGTKFVQLSQVNSPLCGSRTEFYGDINGDGISDIVSFCYGSNNTSKWKINISKNVESYGEYVLNSSVLNTDANSKNMPSFPLILADMNRDGKADIIQVQNSKLVVLFSKGWVNGNYIYKKEEIPITGVPYPYDVVSYDDFNGVGKVDIVVTNYSYYHNLEGKIYSYTENDYDFVKKIEDGIGEKIELYYKHKYIIANDFQPKKSYKKYFISLVGTLKRSNGIGYELNEWQFQYSSPIFSATRRVFLGFGEFISIDKQINKKDVLGFSINQKQLLDYKSHKCFISNTKVFEGSYLNLHSSLPYNRYYLSFSIRMKFDYLLNSFKIVSQNFSNSGRLQTSETYTYNDFNTNNWLHSEIQTYSWKTITLNGNQKKTVPTQVLTTQQYGETGTVIADTVTYEYYPASQKGRLKWQRNGNIDGSITTNYEYLNPTGVCTLKTVSAAGCNPRTEKYEYDATRRFVDKITNPLNHTAYFYHDPKTGNKWLENNANSLMTTYNYDNFGRLKQINHPDGTFTKDTIYWCSRPSPLNAKYCSKTTTTGQPDLIVYYDMLGREVCRLDDGNYYDTRYNSKGQVTQTSYPYTNLTDPDNSKIWNKFEYDNFGRINKKSAPYDSVSYSYNSRKVTVTDHLRNNQSSWKDYDALGRITKAEDPGGLINYTYTINPSKRHVTTIESNGATTAIETDLWSNRLKLTEPNAGTITSEYNKFNELKKQTDANGNITLYTYDLIGRVITENFTSDPNHLPYPPSVVYTYDTGNKALGKVSTIEVAGKLSEKYTYDNFGRVASKYHNIGTFHYTYNQNGQLQQLKYPGGNFAVNYKYTTDGKLKEIRRSSDNTLIYKVNTRNKYQQPTNVTYGSSRIMPIATQYKYNDFGMITGIKTTVGMQIDTIDPWGGTGGTFDDRGNGTVMNYVYGYNEKGLMTSRTDNTVNQNENYSYDNLDRLIKNTYYDYKGKKVVQTFKYQPNGNILSNSQVGDYIYDPVKKHAVTQIECPNPDLISENRCDVVYNRFNQPTQITESDRVLTRQIELSYGANRQRNKAVFKENDTVVSTHYYSNKYYERVKDAEGNVFYHHYIYGDGGVVALHIAKRDNTIQEDTLAYDPGIDEPIILRNTDTTDVIYYIHTDHLGSYCALTDTKGNVVQRNCFDPWGNYAFEKWYICTITHPRGDTLLGLSFPITRRGFTSHEHYPQFKIINMNGRLYDPVIARFFSPDTYVQDPTFTQAYNRYSYCLNNPLKYVDRTGQYYEDYDYEDSDPGNNPRAKQYLNDIEIPTDRYQHDSFGNLFGIDPGAFDIQLPDGTDDNDPKKRYIPQNSFERRLKSTGMYRLVTVPKSTTTIPYRSESSSNSSSNSYYLLFDGGNLHVIETKTSQIIYSTDATSGKGEHMNNPASQHIEDYGPIPAGKYSYNSSDWKSQSKVRQVYNIVRGNGDWGDYNVPLKVIDNNNSPRSNFYLHGGFFKGSAGCVDVGKNIGTIYRYTNSQLTTYLIIKY